MTDIIFGIVGLILGGSGIWLFTIKSTRQKAKAEASKEEQDVYQEIISDLREDRRLLKEEKDQDKKMFEEKYNSLDEQVRALKIDVDNLLKKNKKEKCLNFDCKKRLIS